MAAALLIATPFFVVFGALSDKIGRKKIVLTGCLLAVLTYFPIFKGITHFANPALDAPCRPRPSPWSRIRTSAASSSIRWARSSSRRGCDLAKGALARMGVSYSNETIRSRDGRWPR